MANANVVTASGNEITDAVRLAQVEGDGAAWPDGSYGIYDAATNLLQWSYFDGTIRTNTTGIITGADGVNGATSNVAKVTDNAFPVDKGFINEVTLFKPATAGWSYCAYALGATAFTVGQWYSLQFYLKFVSGTASPINVYISDTNSTNTVYNVAGSITPAALHYYSFSFQAGITGNLPNIMFINAGTINPAMVFRIGGAQVEKNAVPTAYKRSSGVRGTRAASAVSLPAANIKNGSDKYWWAVRLTTDWSDADTVNLGSNRPFAGFFQDVNNRVYTVYGRGEKALYSGSFIGGVQTQIRSGAIGAVNRGDSILAVSYFDRANGVMGISMNGANFVTVNTAIANITNSIFYIGTTGDASLPVNGRIKWAAGGAGIPTNTDAAALYALGDNHPSTFNVLSAAANMTFIWPAETVGYFSKIFGGLPDKAIEPAYHLTAVEPAYKLTAIESAYALKAVEPSYKVKSLEPAYSLKSLEPAYKLTGVDIEY